MQAFKTKVECGRALLPWIGWEPSDAVKRVSRLFIQNKDVDIDLVRTAYSILENILGHGEPYVLDEDRENLRTAVTFLETYIQDAKKR